MKLLAFFFAVSWTVDVFAFTPLVSPLRLQSRQIRSPYVTMAAEKLETVSKKEFLAMLAEKSGKPKTEIEEVLNLALETIVDTVSSGKKASFVGFGSFEPRDRAARAGRNPKTGEVLQIAATKTVGFIASKNFKESVKSGGE
uniref:DNA-binding protein HU n=1 Tax=Octactis speculum TaxID=3111310 RepID=A0A7S2GQ29_9STRA